jgi:hypothetical protein
LIKLKVVEGGSVGSEIELGFESEMIELGLMAEEFELDKGT